MAVDVYRRTHLGMAEDLHHHARMLTLRKPEGGTATPEIMGECMLGTWARVAAPVGAGALSLAIGYRPLLWGLAAAAAVAAARV